MRTKLLISILLLCFNIFSKGKIIGVTVDNNRNAIPFTSVLIKETNKVIYSNSEGFSTKTKLWRICMNSFPLVLNQKSKRSN